MGKKDLNILFNELTRDIGIFLEYLRAKFPLFHKSNFFFRDLQFGIKSFYEKKGIILSYSESENLARMISEYLERESIFIKTSRQGWRVNYPEYETSKPGDPFSY